MNFGEKIKFCRKELGMTQEELSKKSGVCRKSLSQFENGITLPKSRSTYTLLANALEVDTSYLRGDTDAFYESIEEKCGTEGRNQTEELIAEMGALFAGGRGSMSERDWDGVKRAIQEHYEAAMERREKNNSL